MNWVQRDILKRTYGGSLRSKGGVMILVSVALVILGVAVALLGEKLFRALLPLVGLVAGFMVGWSGVEAVFGINALSFPVALITGLLVGALTAVLSYLYFSIAITILVMIIFGYASMYLGLALGLSESSFLLSMMALAGGIIGLSVALHVPLEKKLVVVLTSFYGTAMVLVGILLTAGHVTTSQLYEKGIIKTVLASVDNHVVWIAVWVGSALVASVLQDVSSKYSSLDDNWSFEATEPVKKKV